MSVIPALGMLKQEDHEFEASLDNITKLCLKKTYNTEVQLLGLCLTMNPFYFNKRKSIMNHGI
jgi:hypothetical protein